MVCDICNAPGQGTIVSSEEMNTIVRNGFGPKKAGIATSMDVMATLNNLTSQQIDTFWRQQALVNTTPWNLCANCYAKTRPYLGNSDVKSQTGKKWWEFWK